MDSRSFGYGVASMLALMLWADTAGAVALPLQNGWTQYSFGTSAPEAFIDEGIVHLKGAISNGTTGLAFNLPANMRPATDVYVEVDTVSATKGRLRIQPNGDVTVSAKASVFANAQSFTSLDGVKFAINAVGFTPLTLQNGWVGGPISTSAPAAAIVNGVVHLKGAMSTGSSGVAFTLPVSMRPAATAYVPVDLCAAAKGRLIIQPSGDVSVQAESNFSDAQCFTSLDGASFAPSTAGFSNLTLTNGWTQYGIGTSSAAVSQVDGIVYFKGAIATTGTTINAFTLPAELRPSRFAYVPIDLCNATKGRLVVAPSGDVRIEAETSFSNAQCFTSLDGASFIPTKDEFVAMNPSNGWVNGFYNTQTTSAALYDGIVHFKGALTGGSTNTLFTLPITMRPDAVAHVAVDLCLARPGRIVALVTGEVLVQSADLFTDAQCFTSLEGASFALAPAGSIPLTLTNGWVSSSVGTSPPSAAIVDGMVQLKGAISAGTPGVAFTLPPAMRPASRVWVSIGLVNATKGRLFVDPNGEVSVQAQGPYTNAQSFTSLDGVKFAPASNTAFKPLTPLNGWVPSVFNGGPEATIVRDIVYLKGSIATAGTNASPFLLSPVLRPAGRVYAPTDMFLNAKGRFQIETSGTVFVQAQNNFADAQGFTSLDGVSYAVPEPSLPTVMMAGVGVLAGIARRRAARTNEAQSD
ncbi:hypothetical protein K2X89_07950 [Myxococcota bacterium]|nr:hypothetical protein [Myxococcota bacterium]